MIKIQDLRFSYGKNEALKGMSLSVNKGEIFGLLGPNGCGKTTLFRILSSAVAFSDGEVEVMELNLQTDFKKIRKRLGIVFQSPSLDPHLKVIENLKFEGALYGLPAKTLKLRIEEMLQRLGIEEIQNQLVKTLSGGLKRRVEIAKGLLHKPQLLILDEPSTGLDPGAKLDLWKYLKTLRDEDGVTVLVTTHLMDEAENCDRIMIMNEGRGVACGRPDVLKSEVSKEILEMRTKNPKILAEKILQDYHFEAQIEKDAVHFEFNQDHSLLGKFMDEHGHLVESMTLRRATLEDVFIHHTGHKFWQDKEEVDNANH